MATRIGDLVIAGFFYNSRPFSTHGRILLRGCEDPIIVELTGNPAEDLRGRGFEFEVPENDRPPTDGDRQRAASFRDQQIGPVGEMTAARKVKTFDGSPEEFYLRSKLGEPPPVRESWCLYLEWFSQNGRVVIEVAAPEFRFLDDLDKPVPSAASEDLAPDANESESADPFGEDEFDLEAFIPPLEEEHADAEDEGYGLIPDDLTRELERSARRVDREIAGDSHDGPDLFAEIEMFDDVVESGEGTPVHKLLRSSRLPALTADLPASEAETALMVALTELALFGVAFHICEHCSIQSAYRIFMEKVCTECTVYPKMRGTSFVQHFSTSDFCEQCQS